MKAPKKEQVLQIRMSMRTEVITRGLDLLSDTLFFYDGTRVKIVQRFVLAPNNCAARSLTRLLTVVYATETEDHDSFLNWSAKGQLCTAIFAT